MESFIDELWKDANATAIFSNEICTPTAAIPSDLDFTGENALMKCS